MHFDENGVQTKGGFATDAEGHKHSYDAKTGDLEDEDGAPVEAYSVIKKYVSISILNVFKQAITP